MTIQLGAEAPDFDAETTEGPVRLHDYGGTGWMMLFSHPRDFSAVCMTELAEVAKRRAEFDARNTRVLGLCIAPLEKHEAWREDFPGVQSCELNFPIVADPDGRIANLYGMVHDSHMAGVACRCVFLIDPAKKVRWMVTYPTTVGRNFDEVLRVLDSLQLTGSQGLVTPVGWRPGDKAVIPPALSDEDAAKKFPEGWEAVAPYLRVIDHK